jgi:hypothetical protein
MRFVSTQSAELGRFDFIGTAAFAHDTLGQSAPTSIALPLALFPSQSAGVSAPSPRGWLWPKRE